MLEIKKFPVNMVEENCYIVNDETKEAVVIDCGAFYPQEYAAIDKYIKEKGLRLKHSLCTHAHFDHTFGLSHIEETYGLRAKMHAKDHELYQHLSLQIQSITGQIIPVKTATLDVPIKEGDIISFGTHQFRVIETAGHTPGGICFYCEQEGVLFSGDSLFEMSIGRTDFAGGSLSSLVRNLKTKILTLPPATRVLPGHGASTTIEIEKAHNPYLR